MSEIPKTATQTRAKSSKSLAGYGTMSGMLSLPSNIAKGIAPIAGATIWGISRGYLAVEWTVLGVSALSAVSFWLAVRASKAEQKSPQKTSL